MLTWASAVLAVTTSAVLDVVALKPFAYVSLDDLCVVMMMINLWSLMVCLARGLECPLPFVDNNKHLSKFYFFALFIVFKTKALAQI